MLQIDRRSRLSSRFTVRVDGVEIAAWSRGDWRRGGSFTARHSIALRTECATRPSVIARRTLP